MRRFFLVPLFALGAVIGFGSEFHHHGACRWQDRQAEYERHVADVCATAALNTQQQRAAAVPTAVAAPQPVVVPAPAPAAPSNVPVVIVNTVPGQAAAPAQPVFYGYPPGYAVPQGVVQYAPPAPVQLPAAAIPVAAPTPAGK